MPYWPSSQPRVLAAGEYTAEVAGPGVEKQSTFDAEKVYFQLPLQVRGAMGPWTKFTWNVSPTSPIFEDACLAIGGKRNAAGGVEPPSIIEGRRFIVTIIKKTSKDGKERNEIVSASPCEGAAPITEEPPAAAGQEPGDDEIPF